MKLVRRRAQGWMQHGAYVQGEGKYQSPTESLTSRVAIVTKQVQNLSSNCIRFGPYLFLAGVAADNVGTLRDDTPGT